MLSASLAGCVEGSNATSSEPSSQPAHSGSNTPPVSQAQLDAYFAKFARLRVVAKRRLRKLAVAARAVPINWALADQRWTALGYIYGRGANIELAVAAKLRAIAPPAPLADAHAHYANGWRLL